MSTKFNAEGNIHAFCSLEKMYKIINDEKKNHHKTTLRSEMHLIIALQNNILKIKSDLYKNNQHKKSITLKYLINFSFFIHLGTKLKDIFTKF